MDALIEFLTDVFTGTVMDGMVGWFIEKATEGADVFVFGFTKDFQPDIAYFNQMFPNASTYYPTFITIGIILVVAIFSITMLFNMLGVVTGYEENPLQVVGRTLISLFMVLNSGLIMNYIFEIGKSISSLIVSTDREDGWGEGVFAEIGLSTDILGGLLKLILTLIILWKTAQLLLEVIERYLVMCLFWYLSPIANATLASKSTSKIATNFYSGAFVQVLICALNMWFLRMAADIIVGRMGPMVAGTSTDVLVSGLIIIGWLEVAKRIDQYLKSMGFSVVQTGGNLGRSITGSIVSLGYAAKSAGRMIAGGGVPSGGWTGGKDIFGKMHTSTGNKVVSNASGLTQGVMSSAEHTVPNQDAFMSTDHKGMAAATIVGDAGKTVIGNSNIPAMNSNSVKGDTLTAGGTQGKPLAFSVETTDGDKVSGHVSRLAEENGIQGVPTIGQSGEKQFVYYDKGSGLPTGTGVEKGQTSTLHDANKATATQMVGGELDINTGAWNHTTMESIGFSDAKSDSQITLVEKGRLELSDSSGGRMGTVLTSSHEGFDSARNLGNYYQDPLTGNQMVGFPESKLDGLQLDAEGFSKYQSVQDVIGSGAVPKGYETLETHGRQTYISDRGGRVMQYEIVTAEHLDMSRLNTYKRMSLPNGGDVYYRAKIGSADTNRGRRKNGR